MKKLTKEQQLRAHNFIENSNITDDSYFAANSYDDDGDKKEMYLVEDYFKVRNAYVSDIENGIDLNGETAEQFLTRHNISYEIK